MSRLLTYFARGCLTVVPLAVTVYVLYAVVTGLDALLGVPFPGLGVVLTLALIVGVGVLVSNVLGRKFVQLFDGLMNRLPLVKLLYGSMHDLVEAFVVSKSRFGRSVRVRVQTSESGVTYLLGFQSRGDVPQLALPGHVIVYVPQAYNIGGQVLAVPALLVEPLDIPPSELFAFLLSGGASGLRDVGVRIGPLGQPAVSDVAAPPPPQMPSST